jgi:hypothetical protein
MPKCGSLNFARPSGSVNGVSQRWFRDGSVLELACLIEYVPKTMLERCRGDRIDDDGVKWLAGESRSRAKVIVTSLNVTARELHF